MRRRREKSIDRITQLPNGILHDDIISKLPLKDQVRTCVLSKSWYTEVWCPFPPRCFDFMHRPKHQEEFINSVECSFKNLHSQRFFIAAFNVSLEFLNYASIDCLDRWLHLALLYGNGLRRVCVYSPLRFANYMVPTQIALARFANLYMFPTQIALASAAPLQELELTRCLLQKNSLCDHHVGPLALRRLCLVSVSLDLGDVVFQNFISRCISLEYLCMDDCYGVKCLQLGKQLSKLKELFVQVRHHQQDDDDLRLTKVCVGSLTLETIRIVGCIESSLVVSFTGYRDLQHLHLQYVTVEGRHFLRNLAPLLHTLYVEGCFGLGWAAVLPYPQRQTIQFSTSNSRQVRLNLKIMCPLYTRWFVQFRAFIAHLKKNSATRFNASLSVYTCTHEFDVGMASEGLQTYDQACDVEELKIHMRQSLDYSTFFDGLFWSCRPKKLFLKLDGPRKESLRGMQEIAVLTTIRGSSAACCMSSHVKCWRHALIVQTINGTDATDMASVLQNQASSSEEIVLALDWH